MKILVLGGGNNVYTDFEAAALLGEYDGLITVNDITSYWTGEILACVSLHAEKWPYWLRLREIRGNYSAPQHVVAHTDFKKSMMKPVPQITDYLDWAWPGMKDSGSSGLFGVKAAIDLFGATKVVACGIPMSAEFKHFFDNAPWGGAASHKRGWLQAHNRGYLSNVRSMSGWTAELVGKPTMEWLDGENE